MSILNAAEVLLTQQVQQIGPQTPETEVVSPLALSPTAVRALYSLQLEMDTVLTARTAALCRLWAEERYRIKKAIGESLASQAATSPAGTAPSPGKALDDDVAESLYGGEGGT
jgi:hypothetical protein